MYNLKKAGMRSKNSCKCSKKLLRALLLSTLFTVPSQFASAQLNIAFIECPIRDNDQANSITISVSILL